MVKRALSAELPASPISDLLGEIKNSFNSFHASEAQIANAVIANPALVANMNITQLAEHSETSVASVVRFSKAMGFRGYPEFRMALVSEVTRQSIASNSQTELDSGITVEDTLSEIIKKIAIADATAIQTTAERIDVKTFSKVVEAWDKANTIGIIGLVSSGFVAQDLSLKLNRQGKNAIAWSDAHTALTSVSLLKKGDCLVAISHSGTTVDIIDAMETFKNRGIKIILITNSLRSPANSIADIVIHTSARETTFRSGATASRIAQLTVVDCLGVALAQRNWSATKAALDDSRAAIRSRTGVKKDEAVKSLVSNAKARSRGGK